MRVFLMYGNRVFRMYGLLVESWKCAGEGGI